MLTTLVAKQIIVEIISVFYLKCYHDIMCGVGRQTLLTHRDGHVIWPQLSRWQGQDAVTDAYNQNKLFIMSSSSCHYQAVWLHFARACDPELITHKPDNSTHKANVQLIVCKAHDHQCYYNLYITVTYYFLK